MPPTRVCLRTRYPPRRTGGDSGFNGAAEWSERCGRCRIRRRWAWFQTTATKALQSVALGLLEEHLSHYVTMRSPGAATAQPKVREASDAIARLVRS